MQLGFLRVPVVLALAAALVVLAFSVAPAFGQAVAIDDGDDAQYNGVCQNIIGSTGDITAANVAGATSAANANAGADDESEAASEADSVAEIAQEAGVSIEQVNECLNGVDSANETTTAETTTAEKTTETTTAGKVDEPVDVVKGSTPEVKALVNTGGPPLLGLALVSLAVSAIGIAVVRGGLRR